MLTIDPIIDQHTTIKAKSPALDKQLLDSQLVDSQLLASHQDKLSMLAVTRPIESHANKSKAIFYSRLLTARATSLPQQLNTKGRNLTLKTLAVIGTVMVSPLSIAATPVEFVKQDWQVVCDNTRTCRMAGYQTDFSSDFPASILLTRKAGNKAEVTGEVKLGGDKKGSNKALLELGNRHRVSLFINDKDLGETTSSALGAGYAALSSSQVTALLDSLTKSTKIELVVRNSRWQVSDQGAAAVMLKADEAQGRVGTASALINPKSTKTDSNVLAPVEAPQLDLVLPNQVADANSNKSFSLKASQLSAIVQGTIKDLSNNCPKLSNNTPWKVKRLNSTQLLAQHSCWSGAYNTGDGMWIINDRQPYKPKLVTTAATSYDEKGIISSVQKGRGIGDCLATTEWVWTGKSFAKSQEGTTGLCRLIADGGAWWLPTFVSQVKR